MSKIKTINEILKFGKNHPKTFIRHLLSAGSFGLNHWKDLLHREIIKEDIVYREESAIAGSLEGSIKFSFLLPVYKTDVSLLSKTLQSIESQTYSNWEICIVDDGSGDLALDEYLQSFADQKTHVLINDENKGISAASNACAELATGQYLIPIDHDDLLSPFALEKIYQKIVATGADILYTDQDGIDESGNLTSYFFKPDWSPDLFLSQMYLGHALAFKKTLFDEVTGFDSNYDGAQDYDLLLRMIEKDPKIEHVSGNYYSWRAVPSSTASSPDAKPYAHEAGKKALERHLKNTVSTEIKVEDSPYTFVYDVRYSIPKNAFASIIIPTKDHSDDLKGLIASIYNHTNPQLFEVIILDNNSSEPKTYELFEELKKNHDNITILSASYDFNWSRLNNQGISAAKGNVFLFLNNDVQITHDGWLERLMENALREDIGVVGNLLLYPDGTIQHAGVVIGLNGWADHIYQGMNPEHNANPFVSPMVRRNVSAVTGACMAISKDTLERISAFDESFIVCGSDVEICLRANAYGLRNLYLPEVKMIHHESKTRNPKDIPSVDFERSKEAYWERLQAGDPYYNTNLDLYSKRPEVLTDRERIEQISSESFDIKISEISPFTFKHTSGDKLRINLLLPSLAQKHTFGGISTALNLVNALHSRLKCDVRIIVFNSINKREMKALYPNYHVVEPDSNEQYSLQIVEFPDHCDKSLTFRKNDWFIATLWSLAYKIQDAIAHYDSLSTECDKTASSNACENDARPSAFKPLIYLIQDYEPGFYPWSTNYLLAESTYRSAHPLIALFNSSELYEHMKQLGYSFYREYYFEPTLNPALQETLIRLGATANKKKQLLFYGRPSVDRNAFSLGVEAIRKWIECDTNATQWKFLSAGEYHRPVPLGNGKYLTSTGKLTLEEYAYCLAETSIGLSLMVSPHPSYPPLEMASFGVKTITNAYGKKDLSRFSANIISVNAVTPNTLAEALKESASLYQPVVDLQNDSEKCLHYKKNSEPFPFVDELISLIAKEND